MNHLCNNRTPHFSSFVWSDSYFEPQPHQQSRARVPLRELGGYFYWVSFLVSFSKERGGVDWIHQHRKDRSQRSVLCTNRSLDPENTAAKIGWTAIEKLNWRWCPV